MSPSKFYDETAPKKEINNNTTNNNNNTINNNARPSPLKIKKDSHIIQKSSSSSSSSTSSSSLATTAIAAAKQNSPPPPPSSSNQQRHPVIIYTHSPKIIHTNARDFMTLVQKLTGLSHSEEETQSNDGRRLESTFNNIKQDDTGSSSVITEENGGGGGSNAGITTEVQVNSSCISPPAFDPPANPYLSDVPYFTPNSSSSDFYCSSRPYYRYPDHMFSSPNMGGATIPPSVLEVLKGYPDYCN